MAIAEEARGEFFFFCFSVFSPILPLSFDFNYRPRSIARPIIKHRLGLCVCVV